MYLLDKIKLYTLRQEDILSNKDLDIFIQSMRRLLDMT